MIPPNNRVGGILFLCPFFEPLKNFQNSSIQNRQKVKLEVFIKNEIKQFKENRKSLRKTL